MTLFEDYLMELFRRKADTPEWTEVREKRYAFTFRMMKLRRSRRNSLMTAILGNQWKVDKISSRVFICISPMKKEHFKR